MAISNQHEQERTAPEGTASARRAAGGWAAGGLLDTAAARSAGLILMRCIPQHMGTTVQVSEAPAARLQFGLTRPPTSA